MRRLETPRLILRRWRPSDAEPYAAINADPVAMEFFPSLSTRAESDAAIARIDAALERDGFGLWAVEVRDGARFIGFTGAQRPSFEAHFTPCIEVGWRLAPAAWGHGYATEAARAVIDDVFAREDCDEIVAMTAVENRRSRAVMERLGMRYDPADDFDHPRVPDGHRLKRHVLYRLPRSAWPGIT
jgi:ribosomal-protein-alanine N-acetyltransferase